MTDAESGGPRDWNVVANAYEREYREACRIPRRFGKVAPTDCYNVVALKVDDPAESTRDLGNWVEPASITIDDPDAGVVTETVGQWAGVSSWTREKMERHPFLRLDKSPFATKRPPSDLMSLFDIRTS